MLTNKDIIESLVKVGYTMKEISGWTKLSNKTLNKLKKNEEVNAQDEVIINDFFRLNMAEVDIDKFSDETYRDNYLIMTPTGFKKVSGYKDNSKQKCLTISFSKFNTTVTNGHKLQLDNGSWTTADKVKVGDKIKMYDDFVEITDIKQSEDIECCSITVEDNEYYLDGTVSM